MDNDDLIRRCEALYDRIVRDVDEARNDSWHALFMRAYGRFHEFITNAEEPAEIRQWIMDCQSHLLEMAPLAPKLSRELLSIPRGDSDPDVEDFARGAEDKEVTECIAKMLWSDFNLLNIEASKPFAEGLTWLDDDLHDLIHEIGPAWRCWQMGTAGHMLEASWSLSLSPWHWTGHLFHAISVLNVLRC